MRKFRAELHTHTVLSPCASIEMIPPLIIAEAEKKEIDILAVTDHNHIANIKAVMDAARSSPVTVIPGLELQTREEVHSICLFDSLEQINTFYEQIYPTFPNIENDRDFFGEQFIVDKTGDFIRREERLLIASADLSLNDAYSQVINHGGLMIPAHVNRSAYGLMPVLGFVPPDLEVEILEISKHLNPQEAVNRFPQLKNYYIIQNGDAHFLEEITGFNLLEMEEINVKEISAAIRQKDGRKYKNLYSNVME